MARAYVANWMSSRSIDAGSEDDVFIIYGCDLFVDDEFVFAGTVIIGHADANGTVSENTMKALDAVQSDFRLVLCYPGEVRLAYPSLTNRVVGDWDCATIAQPDPVKPIIWINCEGE